MTQDNCDLHLNYGFRISVFTFDIDEFTEVFKSYGMDGFMFYVLFYMWKIVRKTEKNSLLDI